jgi:signal transduction histidine kinase
MKIINKILIAILSTFAVLIGAIHLISAPILLQSFESIERSQMQTNIERIDNTINNEIQNLLAFNTDWAAWDDTYEFIESGSKQYLKANIVDSTYEDSRLDVMVFVNSRGRIVFGKEYYADSGEQKDLSKSLLEHLVQGSLLTSAKELTDTHSGILDVDNELYIFTSHPIVDSEKTSPVRGVLIMGRKIDKQLVDMFAKTLQLDIRLHTISSFKKTEEDIAKKLLQGNTGSAIISSNEDRIEGYVLFKDIYEKPVMIIDVSLPREIYYQGKKAVNYQLVTMIIIIVMVAATLIMLIKMIVVSRLTILEKSVSEIEASGDINRPLVRDTTNDELGHLVIRINSMLDSLRKSHTQLEEARQGAEIANKAKSEFLTNMSHELRTPLHAILGFAQLVQLNEKDLSEDDREWVEQIIAAGDYLLKLISELLELSQIETGKIDIDIRPVKILDVINSATKLLNPVIAEHNIRFSLDANALKGIIVDADEMRLQQVFINLVTNAIKYNKPQGSVDVIGKLDGQYCCIYVKDTGVGIPPDEIEAIFKSFHRVSATKHKVQGTGVGLTLTKKIIQAMGGTIEVDSEQDVGSTFTVRLPIKA